MKIPFTILVLLSLYSATLAQEQEVSATLEDGEITSGAGYTLVRSANKAHFYSVGSIIPTRGYAHLQSTINLRAQYEATNRALLLARSLFIHQLARNNITLEPNTMDIDPSIPIPPPPRPEEIFTLRGKNYIREYLLDPAHNMDGEQILHSFYYLSPLLRAQVVEAYGDFTSQDATQSKYIPVWTHFLRAHRSSLVKTLQQYLSEHDGPYPHIQQNPNTVIFNNTNEGYSLDFGQLLHRAATIRLETAAQADLTRKLGETSIHAEHLYQGDQEVKTIQQNSITDMSWDEIEHHYHLKGMSPNPLFPHSRHTRAIALLTIGLITTVFTLLTTSATVMGIYSVDQLNRIEAQITNQRQQMGLVTRAIDHGGQDLLKVVDSLTNLTMELAQEIKEVKETVRLIRVGMALALHLDEVADEVHRTAAMMDALAHQRISSSFASSYALHRTTKLLIKDAKKQNNVLLIDTYGDVFQCQASFILRRGFLHVFVHIPMGRPNERMDLWKFEPYPFTGHEGGISQIDSEGIILAANNDLTLFQGFTDTDLSQCQRFATTHVCQAGTILRTAQHLDRLENVDRDPAVCLFSLFSKRHHLLAKACHVKIGSPRTLVSRIGHDTFRVATQQDGVATINCGQKFPPTTFQLSNNFDVQLHPACSISFLSYYMFGGDILRFDIEVNRTIWINWDPAVALQVEDAKAKFVAHAERLKKSLLSGGVPFLPETLSPVEDTLDYLTSARFTPVRSIINFFLGSSGFIVAIIVLGLLAFFLRRKRAGIANIARSVTNSVLDIAQNLTNRRQTPHPRNRRPSQVSFVSHPWLRVIPGLRFWPRRRNNNGQVSGLSSGRHTPLAPPLPAPEELASFAPPADVEAAADLPPVIYGPFPQAPLLAQGNDDGPEIQPAANPDLPHQHLYPGVPQP